MPSSSSGRAPSARRPSSSAKTPSKADNKVVSNQQPPAAANQQQPGSSREKPRASNVAATSNITTTTGNSFNSNTRRRSSNDKTATSTVAVATTDAEAMVGTAENVRVVVRCRPLNSTEKQNGNRIVVSVDKLNDIITVHNPAAPPTTAQNSKQNPQTDQPPKQFSFDTVFDIGTTQLDVYNEAARPVVESCLQGFNGTILAYGQTGTGKTYTMEGNRDVPEQRGIIPNSFAHIFAHIAEAPENRQYLVRVSYFEIYQEDLHDLLSKNHDQRLEVKENPQRGVYVKDLSEKVVHSPQELDKWMTIGNKNRSVGATQMNEHSSRSHAIFTITIERSDQDAAGAQHVRAGKLHLVDLAGSERQTKTGSTGQRFKEATKINLALSALGNVISALVDGKSQHIPYRNAKLTRILQDSLGGNSKTLMIANCGPADYNYDETINTLRYASRAKNIKNVARINEDPKDALLRKIYEQIADLKRQMEDDGSGEEEDDEDDENPNETENNAERQKKRHKIRQAHSTKSAASAVAAAHNNNNGLARRGSRIEKMMEMKAQILADRETLLKDKTMADEERQEMTHKLAEKEKSLMNMQEERNRLAEKLNILQNSIIVGGENLLEKAEEQQHLLEESQRELELRRAEEEKLRKTLEDKARQRQAIEQKHATLQDLLERKRNDMQSLIDRVQALRSDVTDAESDLQREREDSEEHLKRLRMDVARADLIIRSYIPEHYVQLIMRNCYWNDAINEYQLNCYAYTGNQMKQQQHYAAGEMGCHGGDQYAKRKTREHARKLERRMLNDQSHVFYTYATCDKAPVAAEQRQTVSAETGADAILTSTVQRVEQQQAAQPLLRRPQTSMSTASMRVRSSAGTPAPGRRS